MSVRNTARLTSRTVDRLTKATFLPLTLWAVFASAGSAWASTSEETSLDWDTKLKHFQVDAKKFVGQRFGFECPKRPDETVPAIHGTNIYPSDTPLCAAALHAGAIGADGGPIKVQLNPGLEQYTGRTQRNVRSSPFGATPRSFVFLGEAFADSLTPVQRQHAPRLEWRTKFTATGLANRRLTGQRFVLHCPAAPAKLGGRRVYGTDRYAFNSLVCLSAVHAGRITREGGFVLVKMIEATTPLKGSLRYGIESKSGATGDRQLVFLPLPTELENVDE